MKKFEIITVPDPVLRQVAHPVESINDSIRAQMDAMLETMYAAPGIGLAANQVGMLNRVIVVDLSRRSEDADAPGPYCMANPEIIWQSEEKSLMEEGCLSIPQQYAEVERPARVRVRYVGRDGQLDEVEADGLFSHCLQHEIDHLNGVLFVDYLSSLRRNMMIRKVEKMKRDAGDQMIG